MDELYGRNLYVLICNEVGSSNFMIYNAVIEELDDGIIKITSDQDDMLDLTVKKDLFERNIDDLTERIEYVSETIVISVAE